MANYLTDPRFQILTDEGIQEGFRKLPLDAQQSVLETFDNLVDSTANGQMTERPFSVPFIDEEGKSQILKLDELEVIKNSNGEVVGIYRSKLLDEVSVTPDKKSQDNGVDLPRFSYEDFSNERSNWVKGTDINGERGYFYFKIFFKFNTNNGLFGSIFNQQEATGNSAVEYLSQINNGYYNQKLIEDKAVALFRFTHLLAYINSNAPWFFNSIKGLDEASVFDLDKPILQQTITIGCRQDAIDMRISNLMDLYKFACYDAINRREIIPDNLRKFDMSVMIMNVPIKYYHTAFKRDKTEYKEKTSYDSDYNCRFGYKIFSFKNCEILLDEFKQYYEEMKIEDSFESGKAGIKIKYDRVYQHSLDEWNQIMFGDEGIVWTQNSTNIMGKDINPNNQGNSSQSFKSRMHTIEGSEGKWNIVETTENIIRYNMEEYKYLGNLWDLGNLYSGYSLNNQIYDIGSAWGRIKSIGSQIQNGITRAKANTQATIDTIKNFGKIFDSGSNNEGYSDGKFFLGDQAVYEENLRRMREKTQVIPRNEALKLRFDNMYPKKNLGNLYR